LDSSFASFWSVFLSFFLAFSYLFKAALFCSNSALRSLCWSRFRVGHWKNECVVATQLWWVVLNWWQVLQDPLLTK
jgi:hypothetical protein